MFDALLSNSGLSLDRLRIFLMVAEAGSIVKAAHNDLESGHYAGILPMLGTKGLESKGVLVQPFAPLKGQGRVLALHWNERQMARRGLERNEVLVIADLLRRAVVTAN